MGDILKPKVQASGLMDVAMLGLSKSATERILTPIIGNATISSGAMKLFAGGVIQGRGKIGQAVGGGLVIDGVEDLVTAVLGGKMGGDAGAGEWD